MLDKLLQFEHVAGHGCDRANLARRQIIGGSDVQLLHISIATYYE